MSNSETSYCSHILNTQTKMGEAGYDLEQGDTMHYHKGVSHYIRNTGTSTVSLVSCIFPGD